MRHHIQGMIKRRDGRNRRERIPLGIDATLLSVRCQIARKNFAIVDDAELAR